MILITGPSGNVGSEIIKLFESAQIPCISAGRKNSWSDNPTVEYRYFDFEDAHSFAAIRGVHTVFLVRPPHISNIKKGIGSFLERCKDEGVTLIVFLSVVGVEKLPFVPHYKIEKKIEKLGLKHAFVRAGFFMQNLSTTHLEEIRDRNEIVVPCGRGKTTFVHVRDIAEVCFQLLTEKLQREKVDVVGNDTLDYFEIARVLSNATGKTITYKPVSPMRFLFYRWKHGTPLKFALVMLGIYMPTRFGKAQINDVDISGILNHAPTSFEHFCRESSENFITTFATTNPVHLQ